MSKIKIDIAEPALNRPKDTIEPVKRSPAQSAAPAPKPAGPAPFRNRVPANWAIVEDGTGKISARNSRSNEVFSGTIAEFNARMRG